MLHPTSPCRIRIYQNHHLDSTRWDRFRPRVDAVLISTSYKSGTTWMQRIVSLLLTSPHGSSGCLGSGKGGAARARGGSASG